MTRTRPTAAATSAAPRRSRARTAVRAGAATVLAGVGVLLGVPVLTGTSLGAWAAELGGRTDTASYGSLGDAPASALPGWLPERTSDITVVRPGPDADVDRSLRRVDAVVPAGWRLPADCAPAPYSQPWDGGGSWPLTTASDLSTCPDGDGAWTVLAVDRRVYAWR